MEKKRNLLLEILQELEHADAAAQSAGELLNYLQNSGFSPHDAKYITESLEMYECFSLQYVTMNDIRTHLSKLKISERDKFILLVDRAKQHFGRPSVAKEDAAKAAQAASRALSHTTDSSSANQYIIGGALRFV